MAKRKIKSLSYKRKRQGRTNYKKRLNILKSKKKRLVVRKSLNNILLQIIIYNNVGDKVLVTAHSSEVKKLGWKFHTGNIPCAYLTGYLLGIKAIKKGIKEVITDIGLYTSTKGSRIYASIKGVIDAGLNIPHSNEILPDEKRINGEHIKNYFEQYLKSKIDPKEINKKIEEIKKKIKESR